MRWAIILMVVVGLGVSVWIGVMLGAQWGVLMAACVVVSSFFAGIGVVIGAMSMKGKGPKEMR